MSCLEVKEEYTLTYDPSPEVIAALNLPPVLDVYRQSKGFRFPTPNKDVVASAGAEKEFIENIEHLKRDEVLAFCRHWAGNRVITQQISTLKLFGSITESRALIAFAASKKSEYIVRALVYAGADINVGVSSGISALDEAVNNCDASLVGFLLNEGADADVLGGGEGYPATHGRFFHHPSVLYRTITNKSSDVAIVRMLLEAGLPNTLNAPNRYGLSPLSEAKKNGNREVVQLLRHHGAKDTKGCVWSDWDCCCHYSLVFPCCVMGCSPFRGNDRSCTTCTCFYCPCGWGGAQPDEL